MLEYAAHASQTWSADELRRTFEESAKERAVDANLELTTLLGDREPDADQFWEQVATNLAARRLRLLFVADEIPDELAQVTEFLNEQMPGIEVLAVEIKQFRGSTGHALVPRVIGRTAAAPKPGKTRSRRKLTRAVFLDELGSDHARSVANRLLDAAVGSGASLEWGSSGVSLRARCSAWKRPVTVAWLYPPSVPGWMGLTDITFGAAIFGDDPPPGEEFRALLETWADQFAGHGFAVPASFHDPAATGWARGWTVKYDAEEQHVELMAKHLTNVLVALKQL